jgi:hypothetical protein
MSTRPRYNYEGLLQHLAGGRNKDDRPTDKAPLRVKRNWVGNPTVYMYHTPIAEFHQTGAITVRAGGYEGRQTTRANIGDVVGGTLFYPRPKPGVHHGTRIYVTGMPNGVPFKDGCIVVRGSCEWHPDMPAKGVTGIRNMTEEVEEVIPEVRKQYHAALRAFRKQARPFLSFIDRAAVESRAVGPLPSAYWFADLLSAPVPDEDIVGVVHTLVSLGGYQSWKWGNPTGGISRDAALHLFNKGVNEVTGASSWEVLRAMGGIRKATKLCREV